MGNRAVISMACEGIPKEYSPSIYVHWNGGRNSIECFLQTAKHLKVRPESTYGMARLCQIISNFFGGNLSVGMGAYCQLDTDNYDNGVYWINSKFEIIDRECHAEHEEQTSPPEVMIETVDHIIKCNPQFNKGYSE
jgi:hypothetical protein